MKRRLTEEEIDSIITSIKPTAKSSTSVEPASVSNVRDLLVRQLQEIEIYPEKIPELSRRITLEYFHSQLNPGEMVGILAASSIGEQNTQSSLNSVVGETRIAVMIDGKVFQTTIGDLIDKHCENRGYTTVSYGGKNDTENKAFAHVVNIGENESWKIQSVDEDGQVEWRPISKLIRHPLYTKLIKVVTESGREVIATTGLSFLVKDAQGKIVPIEGSDLKVGDRVPVGYRSPRYVIETICLREYLNPSEFVYGTDLWKAREFRDGYKSGDLKKPKGYHTVGKNPAWWALHNQKDFYLPFARADQAMRTLEGHYGINKDNEFYRPGHVYIKNQTVANSQIPETIMLDENFGFLIGIYISEGCCMDNFVTISNYDINVLNRIQSLCDLWQIGWHHTLIGYKYKIMNNYELKKKRHVSNKAKEMETNNNPCDIRIRSTLLAKFLERTCGRGSPNKRIPDFAYTAPSNFIKGMLDGLFSGDGSIYQSSTDYTSCSKTLIEGIVTILSMYDITCTTHSYTIKSNNKNSTHIHPSYCLSITQKNNKRFADLVDTLTIAAKSEKLQLFKTKDFMCDVFWSRQTYSGYDNDATRRTTIPEKLYCDNKQDVFMDAVVSITEVDTANIPYVYDFEVPSTGNFCLLNQLHVRDSFHSSGVFKANLTGGLSRMNELMNATEHTKTPSLTIYLSPQYQSMDLLQVRHLAFTRLIHVKLDDVLSSIDIEQHAQPVDAWYSTFMHMYHDRCKSLSWRVRLVFNVQKLFIHNISLSNIAAIIEDTFECTDRISLAWSSNMEGVMDLWVHHDNISHIEQLVKKKNGADQDWVRGFLANVDNNTLQIKFFITKCLLPSIINLKLSGVDGIKDCYYTEQKSEWRIDTKGGSLKQVLLLNFVDARRCKSNDMHEIFTLFGIEAVKQFLREEYGMLIKVNHRHLELLIDSMTVSGDIQRVTRNGISREQVGSIAKVSFEQPLENFLIAASYGEVDPLTSVSGSITFGKTAQIGTNIMQCITQTPNPEEIPVQSKLEKKRIQQLDELRAKTQTESSVEDLMHQIEALEIEFDEEEMKEDIFKVEQEQAVDDDIIMEYEEDE